MATVKKLLGDDLLKAADRVRLWLESRPERKIHASIDKIMKADLDSYKAILIAIKEGKKLPSGHANCAERVNKFAAQLASIFGNPGYKLNILPVTLEDITAEIDALNKEFEEVYYGDDKITVVTEPITLRDTHRNGDVVLGKFKVWADLRKYGNTRPHEVMFHGKAVTPNKSSSGNHHPHISASDWRICYGRGEQALSNAILAGRLFDAFIVINRVLHNYGGSPYCRLEHWAVTTTKTCSNCGDALVEGSSTKCSCGNEVCPKCVDECVDCQKVYCNTCSRSWRKGLCAECYDKFVSHDDRPLKKVPVDPKADEGPVANNDEMTDMIDFRRTVMRARQRRDSMRSRT